MAHIELARLFIINDKLKDKYGYYNLPADSVYKAESFAPDEVSNYPIEMDISSTEFIMEWEEIFRSKVTASLHNRVCTYDIKVNIHSHNQSNTITLKVLIVSTMVTENTIEVARAREFFQFQLRALLRNYCSPYIKTRSREEIMRELLTGDGSDWESSRVPSDYIEYKGSLLEEMGNKPDANI